MSDDERTDEELYSAWECGDRRAADRLIGRHLQSIGRFFANKVVDASDAEDQTCKTFELCSRKLGSFERNSSFRTYLFGIARNVLRDYIKHKGRHRGDIDFRVTAIHDLGDSPSAFVAQRKDQVLLLQSLRAIPLDYQIVIELSFFEEMTQAQIAEILELPPGTVASRIRRGKQLLDEKMQQLASSPELLESTRHGLQDWADQLRQQRLELDPHDDPG
jgi:RNA polymerase sigma-70 factor (ECF subfamily)